MDIQATLVQQIIAQSPWLTTYCATMPKRFLAQLEPYQLGPNKRLITKGENHRFVYLMYDGSLQIINEFDNNRIFAYAAKDATGFSGLLEFFSGRDKATSTVITLRQSYFLRMHRSNFAQWMDEDTRAFRSIVNAFANQIYPAFFSMGSAHIYPKYIILLQYLAKTYSPQLQTKTTVTVNQTREELAQELGLSLRTTYRLCSRLVEEQMGIIVRKKIQLTREHMNRINTTLENYTYERIS